MNTATQAMRTECPEHTSLVKENMKLSMHAGFLAFLLSATTTWAGTLITVHKSPTCGCCEKYGEYLRKNGFEVRSVDEFDMDAIKKRYGTTRVTSCHTALVNGYVVEGHVPVEAIRKMLKEKPQITGISVPGMPMNSPGMGEMKKGTLTIYAIPRESQEPKIFSVE